MRRPRKKQTSTAAATSAATAAATSMRREATTERAFTVCRRRCCHRCRCGCCLRLRHVCVCVRDKTTKNTHEQSLHRHAEGNNHHQTAIAAAAEQQQQWQRQSSSASKRNVRSNCTPAANEWQRLRCAALRQRQTTNQRQRQTDKLLRLRLLSLCGLSRLLTANVFGCVNGKAFAACVVVVVVVYSVAAAAASCCCCLTGIS